MASLLPTFLYEYGDASVACLSSPYLNGFLVFDKFREIFLALLLIIFLVSVSASERGLHQAERESLLNVHQ